MNDTRVSQSLALIDDARCLLSEIDDELPPLPASHHIAQARAACNRAITELNKLTPPSGEDSAA